MLRRILLIFGLSVFASLSAQAQDKAELFGGFSYMRLPQFQSKRVGDFRTV